MRWNCTSAHALRVRAAVRARRLRPTASCSTNRARAPARAWSGSRRRSPFLMMSKRVGLHALVVPSDGAERADLGPIALDVHDLGSVLECAEHLLRRRDEARAGVVRLVSHRAVELGGMRDRFVDREPEVRRVQHEVVACPTSTDLAESFCTASSAQLRRVLDELGVAHVLVAESLRRDVVGLARLEIGVLRDGRDRHRRLRAVDRLHGERAVARRERLLLAQEEHARGDEARALHLERGVVGGEQQRRPCLRWRRERIDLDRALPRAVGRGVGREHHRAHEGARLACACAIAPLGELSTSSFVSSRLAAKPHAPFDERANAEAVGLVVRDACTRCSRVEMRWLRFRTNAHVGVLRAGALGGIEAEQRELFDVGASPADDRVRTGRTRRRSQATV